MTRACAWLAARPRHAPRSWLREHRHRLAQLRRWLSFGCVCILVLAADASTAKPEHVRAAACAEQPCALPEQSPASVAGADPDDRTARDPLELTWLGRPARLAGRYDVRSEFDGDPSFDRRPDDRWRGRHSLELGLLYRPLESLELFAEIELRQESDLHREDDDERTVSSLRRGETWLRWNEIAGSGWALQIGRQEFRDARRWWWDEKLDAVRLRYARGGFDLEWAMAEERAREFSSERRLDPEKERLRRTLGRAGWSWARGQRIDLFFAAQRDHSDPEDPRSSSDEDLLDASDANLAWLGLRFGGEIRWAHPTHMRVTSIGYWLDAAQVRGSETRFGNESRAADSISGTRRSIEGWALDLGATAATSWPSRPSFTLSYAMGSGDDDPTDAHDGAYRQTGLQDNEGRFRGVNNFRYYGELLQPELSNLRIWTLSVGVPILEASSLELSYHRYRQVHAASDVRGAELRAAASGDDRDLGEELDLTLAVEEWSRLGIELTGAVLRAGRAFAESAGDTAWRFELRIRFRI